MPNSAEDPPAPAGSGGQAAHELPPVNLAPDVTGLPPTDVLDTAEAGGLVVRGGIIRVVGFIAGVFFSLAGVIVVTRHLGPERYGSFQNVLSLLAIVQAITDVGMATLGLREYAQRHGEDRHHFMRVLLGLRIALTLAGVAIAVAIAVLAGWDHELVVGTMAGGLGLLLIVMQTTYAVPLGVELRLGTVTALDIARQAGTALLYVAIVLAGGGLIPLLGATIPVNVVLVILTALLVRGAISLRPVIDVRAWRLLLVASLGFAFAMAVGTIYQYVAQLLTAYASDAYQAGLFAASFRTFIVIAAVPGVLVASAFPILSRAARDDRDRLAYALRKLTDSTTLAGVAASLGMILGAPAIIAIIAGDQYAGAVPVLRIQGITMLLTFAITTWGFGLMSLHAHRQIIIANIFSLTATTVAVLVLAPTHGAIGSGWATVIGETVLAVGYFSGLRSVGGALAPSFIVPLKGLLLGGVILAGVAALGLPSIPATLLALVLFAVGVVLARLLPQELIEVLPAPLNNRLRGSK